MRTGARLGIAALLSALLVSPLASAHAGPLDPLQPGTPTGVTVEPGLGELTISWTAPESGLPVTSYVVNRADIPLVPACTATAPETTCTVTGLEAGTEYTFTVTAMALVVPGSASEPASGTPYSDELAATAPPAITGTPQVGETLSASTGEWSVPDATHTYQWMRNGTPVPGADSATLTLLPDHYDNYVTVVVTATLGELTATSQSEQVLVRRGAAPRATERPRLLGTARAANRLRVDTVAWSSPVQGVRYQWLLDGKPVAKATRRGFKVRRKHIGMRVSVIVTAIADGYQDGQVHSKVRLVRRPRR